MRLVAPLTDAERVGFVASARKLVGVPFKHRGRSRRGIDCAGVVAVALASQGKEIADRKHYGRNPANDGLRQTCEAHFGPPVSGMQAGDVALFAWWDDTRNREPNHVGIVFDHPNGGLALVHSLAQNKRVIAHRFDDFALARIVAVYRP